MCVQVLVLTTHIVHGFEGSNLAFQILVQPRGGEETAINVGAKAL